MSNTFGESVRVTLFGESHGAEIGAVLDGMAPGVEVDEKWIADRLSMRRPADDLSTSRREEDSFRIVSGVYRGKTTGTPLCLLIPNSDVRRGDYEAIRGIARPGHADYTGFVKYHGCNDPSGGGHFSGRLTAALVAVGAIAQTALEKRGILLATRVSSCAGVSDEKRGMTVADVAELRRKPFAVLNEERGEKMKEVIRSAAQNGDSVGGILETAVFGMPAGVGEPWFDGIENALSAALFGIPAIKGVEFGDGFGFADRFGSEVSDPMRHENGCVVTLANHNGGINGGITNGMPIVFRCAVKPTPSIGIPQETVDYLNGTDVGLSLTGRHDPAIVHRARAAVEAVTALVLSDLMAKRYGTDWPFGTDSASGDKKS